MSLLAPSQATFVSTLAHLTGLNPRVVGAWALAEQSGGVAKNYEGRHYNDWLNIANTDSGQKAGSHSSVWGDPVSAARATAAWLRGQRQIAKEYGAPAPGVRAILNTAHLGPTSQISGIAHSGWASSGYDGGATLQALYGQLGGEKLPQPGSGQAPETGERLPGTTSRVATFDRAGYEQAQKTATADQLLGFTGPLGEALKASVPQLRTFAGTKTVHVPGEEVGHHQLPGGTGTPGGYGGFVEKGAKVEQKRRDQGRDLQLAPGAGLLASGEGVVVAVKSDPTGFGPDYPLIHFTSGPDKGKTVYFGHVDATVHPGQHVHDGQVIARTSHTGHNAPPGWVEIGLAEGGVPGGFGQPLPAGL